MATPPESTKANLRQQLTAHARANWPELADLDIRHRAGFAYISGQLADGTTMPLFRLRYTGSARIWGFAIYLASKDKYEHAQRNAGRHSTGSPRLRLRPLPQQPHSLAAMATTPDELSGVTTSPNRCRGMSLPGKPSEVESRAVLRGFRAAFYDCLTARRDALFELCDAVLCAEGQVKTLVGLSLAPEHRRGHGALYARLPSAEFRFARIGAKRRAFAKLNTNFTHCLPCVKLGAEMAL